MNGESGDCENAPRADFVFAPLRFRGGTIINIQNCRVNCFSPRINRYERLPVRAQAGLHAITIQIARHGARRLANRVPEICRVHFCERWFGKIR